MPLVAYALAAYIAGLLAGFGPSPSLSALALGAAFVVGYRRNLTCAVALAVLAGAGGVIAHSARTVDDRCLRDAARARGLRVVVQDSVAPGAYVRGHLETCEARVALAV